MRYTPLLNGVKEDIIISEYTGQNTFYMNIETNGLKVVLNDKNQYILADPVTNEEKCLIGDIYIHDSASQPLSTYGTINVKTLEENNLYELEIIAPEEFLTKEEVTYPVIIDPTITMSGIDSNLIVKDVPVYSAQPNTNFSSGRYSSAKLGKWDVDDTDGNLGVGRLAVSLEGLEKYIDTSLHPYNITDVTYKMRIYSCPEEYLPGMTRVDPTTIDAYYSSYFTESTVNYNRTLITNLDSSNKLTSFYHSSGTSVVASFNITNFYNKCSKRLMLWSNWLLFKNSNENNIYTKRQLSLSKDPVATPYIEISYTENETLKIIPIDFVEQEMTNWCWAATARIIALSQTKNKAQVPTQTACVTKILGSPINESATDDQILQAISYYATGNKNETYYTGHEITDSSTANVAAKIRESINYGFPILLKKSFFSSDEMKRKSYSHAFIIYGYRKINNNYEYYTYDPYGEIGDPEKGTAGSMHVNESTLFYGDISYNDVTSLTTVAVKYFKYKNI